MSAECNENTSRIWVVQAELASPQKSAMSLYVAAIIMDKARLSKLTELLPLQVDHLAGEEVTPELGGQFALDSSELGNTTVVTHSIDTGK